MAADVRTGSTPAASITSSARFRDGVIISAHDMDHRTPDHGLDFLLAFNGRIHHLEKGYWLKFEIARVAARPDRPHGLSYSFTLHAPDGRRLVGFDNAHDVPPTGSRFKQRGTMHDHWRRSEQDPGRPYRFKDAETVIDDFFDAVERALTERGVPLRVIAEDGTERVK